MRLKESEIAFIYPANITALMKMKALSTSIFYRFYQKIAIFMFVFIKKTFIKSKLFYNFCIKTFIKSNLFYNFCVKTFIKSNLFCNFCVKTFIKLNLLYNFYVKTIINTASIEVFSIKIPFYTKPLSLNYR